MVRYNHLKKNLQDWSCYVQNAPKKDYLPLTYVGPGQFNPEAIKQFFTASGFETDQISYSQFLPDAQQQYDQEYSISFLTKKDTHNTQGILFMSMYPLTKDYNYNIFKTNNIADFFNSDVSKKLFDHLYNRHHVREFFLFSRIPGHCLLAKISNSDNNLLNNFKITFYDSLKIHDNVHKQTNVDNSLTSIATNLQLEKTTYILGQQNMYGSILFNGDCMSWSLHNLFVALKYGNPLERLESYQEYESLNFIRQECFVKVSKEYKLYLYISQFLTDYISISPIQHIIACHFCEHASPGGSL
jgi:hypothetical protein